MSQQLFPITNYQTANGSPVANGHLVINLSSDGVAGTDQVSSRAVTIPLDVNGNIIGSPLFWPNDQITPAGTQYVVQVFSADGQRVALFYTSIASGQTASPPVPIPSGQSLAWSLPTAVVAGSQVEGATNGSVTATLSSASLTMTSSGPLGNYIWGRSVEQLRCPQCCGSAGSDDPCNLPGNHRVDKHGLCRQQRDCRS